MVTQWLDCVYVTNARFWTCDVNELCNRWTLKVRPTVWRPLICARVCVCFPGSVCVTKWFFFFFSPWEVHDEIDSESRLDARLSHTFLPHRPIQSRSIVLAAAANLQSPSLGTSFPRSLWFKKVIEGQSRSFGRWQSHFSIGRCRVSLCLTAFGAPTWRKWGKSISVIFTTRSQQTASHLNWCIQYVLQLEHNTGQLTWGLFIIQWLVSLESLSSVFIVWWWPTHSSLLFLSGKKENPDQAFMTLNKPRPSIGWPQQG